MTGLKMSVRDQRGGTSLSDSGLHDVFSMSPLSNLSEFSLKRLGVIARAPGSSALRDISRSSRVSVGSFQRSLKKVSKSIGGMRLQTELPFPIAQ